MVSVLQYSVRFTCRDVRVVLVQQLLGSTRSFSAHVQLLEKGFMAGDGLGMGGSKLWQSCT